VRVGPGERHGGNLSGTGTRLGQQVRAQVDADGVPAAADSVSQEHYIVADAAPDIDRRVSISQLQRLEERQLALAQQRGGSIEIVSKARTVSSRIDVSPAGREIAVPSAGHRRAPRDGYFRPASTRHKHKPETMPSPVSDIGRGSPGAGASGPGGRRRGPQAGSPIRLAGSRRHRHDHHRGCQRPLCRRRPSAAASAAPDSTATAASQLPVPAALS
jgi:hypothetical protein